MEKCQRGKKNLGGRESWETSRRLRCLDSPPALRRPPGAGDGPPAPDSPEDHPGKGRHPDTLEGILEHPRQVGDLSPHRICHLSQMPGQTPFLVEQGGEAPRPGLPVVSPLPQAGGEWYKDKYTCEHVTSKVEESNK